MLLIKVTETGTTPRRYLAERNRIHKEMWRALGEHWHRYQRPKHFTRAGAAEYAYAPRSGDPGRPHPKGFFRSYQGRKQRRFGHMLPLVYTGLSRNLTRLRDVRPTGKGVRVVMRAPALNLRPRGGHIHMRDELTTISQRDAKALVNVGERRLGSLFARSSNLRRTTRLIAGS